MRRLIKLDLPTPDGPDTTVIWWFRWVCTVSIPICWCRLMNIGSYPQDLRRSPQARCSTAVTKSCLFKQRQRDRPVDSAFTKKRLNWKGSKSGSARAKTSKIWLTLAMGGRSNWVLRGKTWAMAPRPPAQSGSSTRTRSPTITCCPIFFRRVRRVQSNVRSENVVGAIDRFISGVVSESEWGIVELSSNWTQ